MSQKILYIIDGFNLIFRMFYAVPEFRTKDGVMVNAVFGVTKALLQIINEENPTQMVVAFDAGEPTFRKDLYEDYKSNRDKMPDDLSIQIDAIFQVFELLGIKQVVKPGFEADDIIGTMATRYADSKDIDRILILSSDKDLFQFIGPKVRVYDAMKKRVYDDKAAHEKFGVEPKYILDYLAIVGDTSDCIPGVKGIGPKGASNLINTYGTLEEIYENIDKIEGRTHDLLVEAKDIAFLSKKLATIDVDIDIGDPDLTYEIPRNGRELYTEPVLDFFNKYEFHSLIPKDLQEEKKTLDDAFKLTRVNASNFEDFLKTFNKQKKITLATTGSANVLKTIDISWDPKEVFELDAGDPDTRRFVEELLSSGVEVVGYDLKTDIRRMEFYLKSTELLVDDKQGSLF